MAEQDEFNGTPSEGAETASPKAKKAFWQNVKTFWENVKQEAILSVATYNRSFLLCSQDPIGGGILVGDLVGRFILICRWWILFYWYVHRVNRKDLYYHYFGNIEHALEVLEKHRLYLSSPSQLNDPLDLFVLSTQDNVMAKTYDAFVTRVAKEKNLSKKEYLAQEYGDQLNMKILRKAYKECRKFYFGLPSITNHDSFGMAFRIFCLTALPRNARERRNEILMWSHYANGHKGVRIQFHFRPASFVIGGLVPVCYRNSPPKWRDSWFRNEVQKIITRKSPAWKYEREFRWACPNCPVGDPLRDEYAVTQEGDAAYLYVHPKHIVSIDLGVGISNEDRQKIFNKVKEINESSKIRTKISESGAKPGTLLKVQQAFFVPDKYELRYDELKTQEEVQVLQNFCELHIKRSQIQKEEWKKEVGDMIARRLKSRKT